MIDERWNDPCMWEVDKGWHTVIRQTLAKLHDLPFVVVVQQIKEKFGGLRFYACPAAEDATHDAWAQVEAITDAVRAECDKLCEWCGGQALPETSNYGGWVKLYCAEHAEQYVSGQLQKT